MLPILFITTRHSSSQPRRRQQTRTHSTQDYYQRLLYQVLYLPLLLPPLVYYCGDEDYCYTSATNAPATTRAAATDLRLLLLRLPVPLL